MNCRTTWESAAAELVATIRKSALGRRSRDKTSISTPIGSRRRTCYRRGGGTPQARRGGPSDPPLCLAAMNSDQ